MNFLPLMMSCILFSIQFIFSKWYQLRTENTLKAAIRMSLFDSVWLIVLFLTVNRFTLQITPVSVLFAAAYSGFAIVCIVVTLFAMQYGKVSEVSLFLLTGGLILPVLYGVILLGEPIGLQKGIGIVLILISFVMSNLFLKSEADKNPRSHKIRCMLFYITIFICNGMISVITKAHSISSNTSPERDFLILTAILRLLMGLVILIFLAVRKKADSQAADQKSLSLKQILPLFFIVGGYTLCNGIANFYSLISAKTMDSSLQFPIISAQLSC